MKRILLSVASVATALFSHAQVPVCDQNFEDIIETSGTRELDGTIYTCMQNQFTLIIPPTVPSENIIWYKNGENRGGGNPFNTNEAGEYQAIQMNYTDGSCVNYGSINIEFGDLPLVEIDYKTRFFCKDSEGAELVAKHFESSEGITYEWFTNGQTNGETNDTIFAAENASFFVEVNDQGCVGRSAQVQVQEKDCDNIECPEIELVQEGLIELTPNTYRICDEEYTLSLTTAVGSLSDMYFTWTINGEVVSETTTYRGTKTGNVRVIVADYLVCADTIDFVIENGDVSRVQILNKVNEEIQYCLKNNGATLEAIAQPDLDFTYTWYVQENNQFIYYADGAKQLEAPEGDYKVVVGTLECDSISSDEVTVVSFDCEANCFGLAIESSELYVVNDTAYINCRNNFSMNLSSSIANIDQATITWYFEEEELATGKYININKSAEEAVGTYKVVAEEVGVCIDELEFTISNDPIAEIVIADAPVIEYCGTEQVKVVATIEENVEDAISNYYTSWFKDNNGQSQNVGGGFELNNPQSGIYSIELNGDACTNIDSDEIEVIYHSECVTTSLNGGINATIQVVPNPASDYISVTGTTGAIEILSINGNVLLTANSSTDIDVSALSSGTYFIKVITSTGTEVLSFNK